MTPDDAQGSPEPTESAVVTPAPEATQSQTADGTETQAVVEWTPDKLSEDEKESFSKWSDKAKAEYHRQEITRAGNWIASLPAEDRERVKKDPLLIRKLEAQLEEARRAADVKAVGPQNGVPKPPEVNDAESDAKEFLQSEGWTGEEDGYKAMLKHETARIKFLDKRAEKRAAFDPEKATDAVAGRITERQINEQLEEIYQSPEWNDETKGAAYEGTFRRLAAKARSEGKRLLPTKIAEEARRIVYPAAVVKPASAPRPKPSFGDQSSGKVSAAAEADPVEEYNNRLRAKGIDPKTW